MKLPVILLFGALAIPSAQAYIDPGTGATIISGLWPILVAFVSVIFAYIIKRVWHPVKRLFQRKKSEPPRDDHL